MKTFEFSIFELPTVFIESLRGKSLPRIFLNLALEKGELPRLSGKIIDLGAKSAEHSYFRFLEKDENADFHFCDFFSEGPKLMKINLEKPFSAGLEDFSFVLCFNTIEHIFNTKNLLGESAKILKKGGVFMGCVPFLYPYHADPDDFYRYTHSSLTKLFEEHGLHMKKIVGLGMGPLCLGFQSTPMPGILRAFFQSFLFTADKVLNLYYKKYASNFTLIYLFEAVKS